MRTVKGSRCDRVAAVLLGAVLLGAVLVASPAHAAAYRYWTYWQAAGGSWTFATAGPASLVPPDGAVEGWRFAVTSTAGQAGAAPRPSASFDDICSGTHAQLGTKRVALVIDSGESADAPPDQVPPPLTTVCVVAEPDATGYQVLRSVAVVRTEDGLVCGIADYPTGECAPVLEDAAVAIDRAEAASPSTQTPTPAPAPTSERSAIATDTGGSGPDAGTPWPTVAVLVLLAGLAFVLWRRRRGA